MESHMDFYAAKAALDWLIELGADEAICDAPVNRYEAVATLPKPAVLQAGAEPAPKAAAAGAPIAVPDVDWVAVAAQAAASAQDLDGLRAAMAAFEGCELKRGARNLVFADGNPKARVMVIGEAPGREEDLEGKPFVGQAGHMLDKMFAAIGLGRSLEDAASIYVTNVMPWRPPQNREPKPQEIAMMLPFLKRHVELVNPDVVVLMGNISCQAVLGEKGITRLRGAWTKAFDTPALPMFHPAYLVRSPEFKREAWHDLLMVQAKLRETE
ncbi:uracil-DNA glycosylase [Pseudogemmobacter sp. W21_MBD1_M6]|uniref:uracil-DNA glycosylase n=1 Tax=Pseudogemmobacter sp. W21_MBD1_M6 TaxID=3240271 RepID=UPI003F99B2BC